MIKILYFSISRESQKLSELVSQRADVGGTGGDVRIRVDVARPAVSIAQLFVATNGTQCVGYMHLVSIHRMEAV